MISLSMATVQSSFPEIEIEYINEGVINETYDYSVDDPGFVNLPNLDLSVIPEDIDCSKLRSLSDQGNKSYVYRCYTSRLEQLPIIAKDVQKNITLFGDGFPGNLRGMYTASMLGAAPCVYAFGETSMHYRYLMEDLQGVSLDTLLDNIWYDEMLENKRHIPPAIRTAIANLIYSLSTCGIEMLDLHSGNVIAQVFNKKYNFTLCPGKEYAEKFFEFIQGEVEFPDYNRAFPFYRDDYMFKFKIIDWDDVNANIANANQSDSFVLVTDSNCSDSSNLMYTENSLKKVRKNKYSELIANAFPNLTPIHDIKRLEWEIDEIYKEKDWLKIAKGQHLQCKNDLCCQFLVDSNEYQLLPCPVDYDRMKKKQELRNSGKFYDSLEDTTTYDWLNDDLYMNLCFQSYFRPVLNEKYKHS